jgi:D-proline reductase (dithiol) PrdB
MVMPIDLAEFEKEYEKWVEESLPDYRAGKMAEIVKKYPLITPHDIPWAPYLGEPSEQTVAVVTSGGLHLKDSQPPFDTSSIHGDPSIRYLPKSVRQEEIGISHAHFDHTLAEQDINIIFPVHRLLELEGEGVIGSLAETLYSVSYVNNVVPLVNEVVPELISRLERDGVDVLLLVPV